MRARFAAMATASLLALCMGAADRAVAQQTTGTVTGEVIDANTRRPIAGAQVVVVGTQLGGVTTTAGRFLIPSVPAGVRSVRVQLIGFGSAERELLVTAGETAVANFELSQTAIQLGEVVVTGAGVATERRRIGNTVATIDARALADAPILSMSEVFQGREPGVVGLPSSGLTGEGTRIRIRGVNSLAMSSEPIVYLNGVRIDNAGGFGFNTGGGGHASRLDDINPNSIERIEILKGAAAATLYGSEASGGVIQIFTKTGVGQDTRWEFQVEQGALSFPKVFRPNAGFVRAAGPTSGFDVGATAASAFWGRQIQPFEVFEVPITDRYLGTGYTSAYDASVSGSSPVLAYYASGRYAFEDGPIQHPDAAASDVNRKAQGNLSVTVFPRDRLQFRVTSMYTDGEHNTLNNNNNIYAPLTLAMFAQPQRATCYGESQPTGSGACTGAGNPDGTGSFATIREAFQRGFLQEVQHYNGSLNANFRPLDNVGLDATFGVDLVNQRDQFFAPYGWNLDQFTTNNVDGERWIFNRNMRQLSIDTRANWDADVSPRLTSQLVLGMQGFITRDQHAQGTSRNFPGPGFEVLTAGSIQNTTEFWSSVVNAGVLAQEQIGFDNWLFATLGGRYDWNSAFGEAAGGAFYPKFSLSAVLSDRGNWNSTLLSTLRVRGAVGQSGLQPGAFDKFTTYQSVRSEFGAGVRPANLGNPELKPEVTTEWEAGAEFGLFNDRVALEFTYWDRTTRDGLVSRQFPVSGGFLVRQLVNLGQLDANGVEIGLNGRAYQGRNVTVNLFANAAYLKQTIVDMGGSPALKVGESYSRYRNWVREGHAPGAFFGPIIADATYPLDINRNCQEPTQQELLTYFSVPREPTAFRPLVVECNGDFLGQYLGKPDPDWQGAFGGSISFGAFNLNALAEYKLGDFWVHNLTDGFRRAHPSLGGNLRGAVETWAVLVNPASSPQQRLDAAVDWARNWAALAPLDGLNEVERADFIRLRELRLSYNVPGRYIQQFGARHLTLSASARNLAFLYNRYSGTDPEINVYSRSTINPTGGTLGENFGHGVDAFGMPLPRRFTFAARVGF